MKCTRIRIYIFTFWNLLRRQRLTMPPLGSRSRGRFVYSFWSPTSSPQWHMWPRHLFESQFSEKSSSFSKGPSPSTLKKEGAIDQVAASSCFCCCCCCSGNDDDNDVFQAHNVEQEGCSENAAPSSLRERAFYLEKKKSPLLSLDISGVMLPNIVFSEAAFEKTPFDPYRSRA